MNIDSNECIECGLETSHGLVCPTCQELLDGHESGKYSKERK